MSTYVTATDHHVPTADGAEILVRVSGPAAAAVLAERNQALRRALRLV
jgi:hypothetical protein